MNRLAGQAGRTIGSYLHMLGMFVITLFLLVAVLLGGLAYRLSRGPLQIPWVTTLLANAVSGEDIDIHVGKAALGWAGYKKGGGAPLYLQLGDIAVHNAGGIALAAIPDARLEFTPSALFSPKAAIYVTSADARFAGADVPVSLLAGIHLGRGFGLDQADLWVTLGAGQLGPPGITEKLAGGKFLLAISPRDVTLTDGTLTLVPTGGSAPVVHVAGSGHRDSFWHGTITVTGSSVQAADLANYWPAQLAAQTRQWVLANIKAGTAEAPNFTFALSAPGHLSNLQLDNAQGRFKAENLTLTWLPGAEPITELSGSFTLTDPDNINIAADSGMLGRVKLANASMHIAGVAHPDQTGTLQIPISGTLQDAFAVLNAPPLSLLKTVPAQLLAATGDLAGNVDATVPFKKVVTIDDVTLKVTAALTNVTVPLPVAARTLNQGDLTVLSTTKNLHVAGNAMLGGEPAGITAAVVFGPSDVPAAVRFEMKTAITAKTLTALQLNPSASISGRVPLDIRIVTTPSNGGSLAVHADLTPAALTIPIFGWTKPGGKPGKLDFSASIHGQQLSGVSRTVSIDAEAPGLDIESQAAAGGINFSRIHIGNTEGFGRIKLPANASDPWVIDVSGNMLDASYVFNPPQPAKPAGAKPPSGPSISEFSASQPPSGFLWRATAHFDHLLLGRTPGAELGNFDFDGTGQGSSVFSATANGMLGSGQAVDLNITPVAGTQPGDAEHLQLQTTDGGGLLRSLGAYNDLSGGELDFDASYGDTILLTGTTTMAHFRLLDAPTSAKFLEAITVLGIPAAASGPGVEFSKLIAPFSVDAGIMTLKDARVYSPTLGLTASGTIDLNAGLYDIHGTVVPAYALNALPGKIPLIGKLFSPEKGGGLFAMRYSMTGPTSAPKIKINPLSALTPGFFREIFGLGHALEGK